MDQEQYITELEEAIDAADYAEDCLYKAQRALDSAGGWGLFDMVKGGMVTTWIKHGKMDEAARYMEDARAALEKFNEELEDVDQMVDLKYNKTDIFTFADYFMDGILPDLIMQGRINDAKRNVSRTIREVQKIREELVRTRKDAE